MPTFARIQVRRDTSANWASANPVLASGEIGLDTTLHEAKIGDGSTTWSGLDFITLGDSAIAALIADSGSDVSAALSLSTVALLAPLGRFHYALGHDPANAKIVRIGDSTTQGDNNYFGNSLITHMTNGCALAGMDSANLLRHGNTGFPLQDYLDYENGVGGAPVPANPWSATVSAAPDLIIASWLVNDVRGGSCDLAEAIDRLTQFVALRDRDLPDCDIAFWIPAPLTSGPVVANKALTSNVATLTTTAPHYLAVGATVIVAGVDSTFNGTFTVVATPTATTFTYAKAHADVGSTASSGTVAVGSQFLSGITAAAATAIIRGAYQAIADAFPHVVVIDTAPVYGAASQPSSLLMQDQLHPQNWAHWWTGHLVAGAIAPIGKAEPSMGPTRLFSRNSWVIFSNDDLVQITEIEWPGGLTPYQIGQRASTWRKDATTDLYCDGGVVDGSAGAFTIIDAHTVQLSLTDAHFDVLAPAGSMVQLVGDYFDDRYKKGGIGAYLDAPSLTAGSSSSLDVTGVTGIRVGDEVQITAPAAAPAYAWTAFPIADDTVRINFTNPTGGSIDYGTDLWNFRW